MTYANTAIAATLAAPKPAPLKEEQQSNKYRLQDHAVIAAKRAPGKFRSSL
jgi:hypothetical protein